MNNNYNNTFVWDSIVARIHCAVSFIVDIRLKYTNLLKYKWKYEGERVKKTYN